MSPHLVEYDRLHSLPDSREAEARVGGVLRGGFVHGEQFCTSIPGGPLYVPLSQVRDLRYAPYTDEVSS